MPNTSIEGPSPNAAGPAAPASADRAADPAGGALRFDRPPPDVVDVGHARLAHWKLGSGPDLVFVHGWPLSSATFRDLAPLLAAGCTCHLLDLPGAGWTEWTDASPITVPGHTDTIARAIDVLGLERYALLGHDSGAAIARYVAARHGERVRAIVMGNTEIPGHRPLGLPAVVWAAQHLPGAKAGFRAMLASRWLRRSALGFGGCFADKDRLDGPFHALVVEPLLRSPRALDGQFALVEGFDFAHFEGLAEAHRHIACPVQMVWGADDPWFPLAKARRMVGDFAGGCDLVVLAPGKLFVHEERPADFAAHAAPFLARAFA